MELLGSDNIISRQGLITTSSRLAVTNLALITFLALKNTPLAFLTAYSYDRLNILHQLAGYTTIAFAVSHGIIQTAYFFQIGYTAELLETPQICAIVAAFAFLIILASALLLRRLTYEVFYVTHILMYMLILVMVGLHRPGLPTKTVIIIIIAGSMWFSDRLIRGSRLAWNLFGNSATLVSLPGGGIGVTLQRNLWRAHPGHHVFLYIPTVRALETHPFTIASTNPLQLFIKAHDGFSRDLLAHAIKNPDATSRASVDGPYGNVPNLGHYNHVILIAGGSGASFTFGLALDTTRKLRYHTSMATPKIKFIWVVRDTDMLSWYSKELEELEASAQLDVIIYTTNFESAGPATSGPKQLPRRSITTPSIAQTTLIGTDSASAVEKASPQQIEKTHTLSQSTTTAWNPDSTDVEKHMSANEPVKLPSSTLSNMRLGRPDIPALIQDVVRGAYGREKLLFAACGPSTMMDATRRSVAECITYDGPAIDFHCEQFGW